MSFSPVVPSGGYAGWTFLKRTQDRQQAAFQADPVFRRDEAYFRARIGSVTTADQLVSDRRLLKVALGAFGLDADIANTFFLRKVLQDGTLSADALSAKLADKRYQEFSAAFGFGDFSVPRTKLSDFADRILTRYSQRQFEIAVGTRSDPMRLALNAEREIGALAARKAGEDAKWFTIMGNAPLRAVIQTAFNLPGSFVSVDIDQQLGELKDRARQFFGDDTISQFSDPAKMDALLRRYLTLADQGGPPVSGGTAALQLLQSARGASGLLSLLR
ncbi:MAG: DUF1217 domain-containing protein [Rhodobacter sp.]|nr:DUF1217 domain-containing protein [Rhodobacter sp.]